MVCVCAQMARWHIAVLLMVCYWYEVSHALSCNSTVERSFDRKGSDYRNFDIDAADFNLCIKSCCDDAQCVAWSYVRPGVQAAKARCWLKSNTGSASPNPDTVSGVVSASCDSSFDRGVDRPNNDYRSWDLDVADARICQSACCRDENCGAFSYQPPGARGPQAKCYLKNNVGTTVADAGATSGVIRTRFNNPVVAGDAPDPGVLFYNKQYFMVATSGLAKDAFPIRRSNDLATWTFVGTAFPDWNANKNPAWASGDFWAPELHLVPGSNPTSFRLTYTARHTNGALSIGVAVASSPTGPFRDVGAPLFTSSVHGAIDSHFFYDTATKTPWFLWKSQPPGFEYERNRVQITTSASSAGWVTAIVAAKLNANMTALASDQTLLIQDDQSWERNDIEAPWVVKRGAFYYLFYSGSLYNLDSYAIGIARATNMLGPWTKLAAGAIGQGNPVVRQLNRSPRSWLSPGHCSVIAVGELREQAGDNSTYALVYHGWDTAKRGRAALLDKIEWNAVAGAWPSIRGGVGGGDLNIPSENTKPIPGVKT